MRLLLMLCIIFCLGATPAPDASRRDLAQAYLRLDHALRRNPPRGESIREVHKTFDYAMVQVFTRNPGGAIQTMDALTKSLDANAIAPLPERWSDQRIDSVRQNLLDALNHLDARPDLADARKTCIARINLLTNRDADSDSNVFLNSPDELSKQIEAEIDTLKRGQDPYRSLFNLDFWRPIFSKRGTVATRIFAPAPRDNVRRALVIALHGAGGDENLFFQGYGAGLIKDLAMKDDFIVIAPNTFSFITVPDAFDAIVDTMSRLYQIDVSRVYVVGHSLGAMTTAGLVSRFPDRIRANVQIAGGGMLKGVPKLPPTLVILAELDPIFPLERMQQMILSAKATGLPINLSIAHDIGHAGAVDATLEEAVEFLLSH
jgi:predicted esterase